MRKNIILRILMLVLLLLYCSAICSASGKDAISLGTSLIMTGGAGVPFTNWYEVAPWETKICFDWGGERGLDPNQVTADTMQFDIYHDLVVTIQAQAPEIVPGEYEGNKRLYEVGWYIQPVQGDEDISYEVTLTGPSAPAKILESSSASYVNMGRGYYSEYMDANYTEASIRYWNLKTKETELTVPVIT
jgi:hypothetical protein